MKTFHKFLFASIVLMFSLSTLNINFERAGVIQIGAELFAQDNYSAWTDIPVQDIKNTDPGRVYPMKYRGLKLNLSSFRSILANAPFENSDRAINSPFVIDLPMPDGSLSKFYVTEYSMMEPGLAAQFPEIKTYTVKGIDDPYASGKLDFTMFGFHGMVLTPRGDYFIDPVSLQNTENYICFYKSDFLSKGKFECLTEADPNVTDNQSYNNSVMTGENLRTYRLACAATGEYVAFFGGTVAAGQAAIVTAINRVDGVYEREVAVRLVLVANNTNIVFTNSGTDPYTNNNGSTMLGQNQTTLDNVSYIGSANYDIGHVFSTGGGGVAGLGVVCVGGTKARGVTGIPSPVGDDFYIDYVAHEMGHQFGGNHTFNSTTSSCGGGNRNASTAWEPGSGSTIMPYAGICGADDLQPHSDDYFHSGSVSEITSYTQAGSGNSCPVTTATGNTPPTVTVPSGGFTIPINTPFQLTGSATDAQTPNSLTYCWEEFDVGPAGSPNSPSGNAPIFRSFKPDTSSTRVFPKFSDLLNNTQTLGEILPSYTRSLAFRMTVRDNAAGGGGINFGSISFNVNSAAGPFLVTSPNTAVSWNSGIPQTITWNVAGTTAAPVSCALVNIKLSTDGGYTYPVTLISNTANDGSESVVLPGIGTTTARIKVEAVGNIFFDISNSNFTILNTSTPIITHTPLSNTEQISGVYTVNCTITTFGTGPIPALTKLLWSRNNVTVTDSLLMTNTGGTNWTADIPANGSPATYRYYIRTTDSLNRSGFSPPTAPAVLHTFLAQPDNVNPVIVHTPLTDQPKPAWPSTVTATVTDNLGLDSSWVVWYKNSPSPLKQFKLINTSGSTFSAAFNSVNADVAVGDFIYYKIFAQDNSLSHNRDSSSLYSFKIIEDILCEGFFSATFPPVNWTNEFTGTQYWTRNAVSSYNIGVGSAKFDFWNAASGTIQSLYTLTFGASVTGDSLKYDYSYAPYQTSRDSLIIETSTNGGTSYTVLRRLRGYTTDTIGVGNTIKTVAAQSTEYTPASSGQWQTKKLALPVGTNKIKFRARSGFGNNLYLDSICKVNSSAPVPATITIAPQGYYDTLANRLTIRDSATFYLRNITAPYTIVDSAKTVIDSVTSSGTVTFANAVTGTYYLVVKGRNILETWSKSGGQSYTRGAAFSYNFTTGAAQAYGSNLILKGTKYCIYSGDVIQNTAVDLDDIIQIFNAANIFTTGFNVNDLSGDRQVDLSDILISFNNSSNFVSRQAPPGALIPNDPGKITSMKRNFQEVIDRMSYEAPVTIGKTIDNKSNEEQSNKIIKSK